MDREEMLELLESRRLTYVFLAMGYYEEMSIDMLSSLRDAPPLAGAGSELLVSGLAGDDLEQTRIDLAADFAAMFLGMSADPVPPYESVYTSGEELLMQASRDEVLALYREEGLGRVESFNLPEDHVALELEFMGHLCKRTVEAASCGDEAAVASLLEKQRAFTSQHLMAWIPRFCADVRGRAKTDFYRGLADMTDAFVRMDAELLQEALG